jgi:hypothetical protein
MKRSHGWLIACVFAASLTPVVADEAVVGHYGHPSRLAVEGAKTFSAEEILQALNTNLDVAHASSPEAPLEPFKALLLAKTTQGYLLDGFADVQVNVRQEPQRLVLTVVEGPRFTADKVRIEGTTLISDADLQDDWRTGEPAKLHTLKRTRLHGRVESLLRQRGFYRAQFSVERPLDRDQQTADLVVKVRELGAPMRAAEIEISGEDRVTREFMLNFLAIDQDTILTENVREGIKQKLTNSGRFLSVDVEPVVPDDAAQPVRLRITLVPYEKAPPLNEPISREQAALVKFANWAAEFDEGADDLAMKAKWGAIEGEIVGSPRFGMLGWVRGLPHLGDERADRAPPFDLAIVESENEVGIYSFQRQRCLTAVPAPARFAAKMEVTLFNGPPHLDGSGRLSFGVGLKTRSKKARRHCEFKLKQTAVGALALAYHEKVAFAWNNDLLTVTRGDDDMRYVIDSQTGCLIEHSNGALENDRLVRMLADSDEFNKRLQAILTAARDFHNDADSERPLSCVAEYATRELEFWGATPQLTELAHVLRGLLAKGALKRIDEWLAAPAASDDDRFAVPDDVPFVESIDLAVVAPAMARVYGVELGDRLAPRDTWLWVLWREAMFLAAKLPNRLDQPADYLKTSNAGPVQCWITAILLDKIGRDAESRACAKCGLEQLSDDSFSREYKALLVEGHWSGDLPLHVAQTVRQLSEDEVLTLAAGIGLCGYGDETTLQAIAEAAMLLREVSDDPLSDVTARALDLLWRECLKQALEASLTKLAAEPVNMEELQKVLNEALGQRPQARPRPAE